MMDLIIAFTWPIAAIGAIMGTVIAWDMRRKRRRRTDITSLGVVYIWEARNVIRAGWTELAKGDPASRARALCHFTEAHTWLHAERRYGSKRRRLIIARLLENAELGQEQSRIETIEA